MPHTLRSLLQMLRARQQAWILFTFLSRPRGPRDAAFRAAVLAAVLAAAVTPAFLGRGGGDAAQGASNAYAQQLAQLEDATALGYLSRQGDAAARNSLVPDFRLLDRDGNPFRLSDIQGPVVLNFWASWCQPCVEEMPDFEILHNRLGGRLTVVGVNDGETPEIARAFVTDNVAVSYTILLDPTKSMTDGPYRLVGRPTTYYIDERGIIREIRVGFHTLEDMFELSAALLDGGLPETDAAPSGDPDYRAAALNLLASARANFAASEDSINRWRETPDLFDDPGWRRSMAAQVQTWQDLAQQFSDLSPPARRQDLHRAVRGWLDAVQVAGAQAAAALDNGDPDDFADAVGTFELSRQRFDTAAAELEDALRSSPQAR